MSAPAPVGRRGAALAAALPVLAAGAWLLQRFDPTAAGSPFPPCLFRHLTGLYCPGCGLTRALHALAHGDVAATWAMNPLVPVALPLLAAMAAAWLLGKRLPWRAAYDGRAWIAALLAFGGLRNLPGFGWLAPG